jgi:hypothetical protein
MHRGIRGPLGDRGQGPGAGEHRGGGQGQDRHQRRSAACSGAASSTWARAAAMADDATEPWGAAALGRPVTPKPSMCATAEPAGGPSPSASKAVYR